MNKYNPNLHERRSLRLNDYDYSQAGAYFITICTQGKGCYFGDIFDDEMRLNDAGVMVKNVWKKLQDRFPTIHLDESIVMPNHLHGIIFLVGAPLVGAQNNGEITDFKRATTRVAPTLGEIAGAFKSISTNEYIKGVKELQWPTFPGKLWQRNYYEHIIRNEESLGRIREYISYNALKWADDIENPENKNEGRAEKYYTTLFK